MQGTAPQSSLPASRVPHSRPFILGIGGSTRPGSSSERALRVSLDAAACAGADTMLLTADALDLPMYVPERDERTPAAARLVSALARTDGLLIASPSYHGGLSGLIKNALDYAEDLRDDTRPYLDGRAVGCIACAHGSQATTTTLVALRSVVHALRGWPTPLGVAVNTTVTPLHRDGSIEDARARLQLRTVGNQVVEFAQMRRGVAPGPRSEEAGGQGTAERVPDGVHVLVGPPRPPPDRAGTTPPVKPS